MVDQTLVGLPTSDLPGLSAGDTLARSSTGWQVSRSRTFNACDYGASVNNTAAQNATAILAAIADAVADSGPRSVVYFGRPGVYLLDAAFAAGDSYILDGDGHTTLRSTVGVNAVDKQLWLQGSHLTVRGIDFDAVTPLVVGTHGGGRSSDARTIRIGGFRGASIPANVWAVDIEVSDCSFLDSRNTPIESWFGNEVRILRNRSERSLGNGYFIGHSQYDVWIKDNIVRDTGDDGIFVTCDANVPGGTRNVIIEDNTVRLNSAKGMGVGGVDGAIIRDNLIDTTFSPAIMVIWDSFYSLQNNLNVRVEGNIVRNAGTHFGAGLFHTTVASNANGIEVTGNPTNVVVRNNDVLDTQGRAIHVLEATGIEVTGNRVIGAGSFGIEVGNTATTTYDDVADFRVDRNTVRNTVSGIILGGAARGTVQGNLVKSWDSGAAGETRAIFVSGVREVSVADNLMVNDDSGTYGYRVNPSSTNVALRDWNNQLVVPGSNETNFPAGVTAVGGGKEVVQAHGAMGATETFDLGLANIHTGTLDANCAFTFTGATNTQGCSMVLILTQDATGGRTITWPGSVDWPAGAAPSLATGAGKVSAFTFLTTNGGSTWLGFLGGDDLR